jgi:hypothetical protein
MTSSNSESRADPHIAISSGCVADAQLKLGVANDGVAKIKETATVVSQHKRQTVRMGRFLMLPYARQTMDRR